MAYQAPRANEADENGNEVENPAPAAVPEQINVKFQDAGGNEVIFKLKPTTKLSKAMDAFSARYQRDIKTLRFLFDGVKVLKDTTPSDLEMQDGDIIEVFQEQIGGGESKKNIARPHYSTRHHTWMEETLAPGPYDIDGALEELHRIQQEWKQTFEETFKPDIKEDEQMTEEYGDQIKAHEELIKQYNEPIEEDGISAWERERFVAERQQLVQRLEKLLSDRQQHVERAGKLAELCQRTTDELNRFMEFRQRRIEERHIPGCWRMDCRGCS